jgi:hypothetical protein
MAGLVIALVLFVGLPALALRYGVDSHRSNGWTPPSDWRERDVRR